MTEPCKPESDRSFQWMAQDRNILVLSSLKQRHSRLLEDRRGTLGSQGSRCISRDFFLAHHTLPTCPEPARQKMAQSPLNLSWASVAENGSISPQPVLSQRGRKWLNLPSTCWHWGGRPNQTQAIKLSGPDLIYPKRKARGLKMNLGPWKVNTKNE